MPDELTRPATFEDLKTLVRALNENGVEYLLVGAYALYAYGVQRATTDIDLLVQPNRHTCERLKRALLVLPDQAAQGLDPQWFTPSEATSEQDFGAAIRVNDVITVDILFNASGETYSSLKQHAVELELAPGLSVKTVSLEGLLKTKQGDRPQDRADREVLEQALAKLHGK